jgi:glutamate synthase (NADPH/NADH) small chain
LQLKILFMAIRKEKVPVREQDAKVRATNFEEVCYGYNMEEAMSEAERCIQCKKPGCIEQCPVSIKIPAFIQKVKEGNIEEAARILLSDSTLPSVCGRVCPQESQCEGNCIIGKNNDSVSIGKLERFVGDWVLEHGLKADPPKEKNGKKVAVIGSGPAGLSCAADLQKMGYAVTIFEALHKPGGVLEYGIPEFRLPKDKVVRKEIENILKLGVKIETDVIVGRTVSIDQLLDDEGFAAIFIGSGAGLPKFMSIPGENLNGVFSANEYLTRANLMKAYEKDSATPIYRAKRAAVVGGGNVAMDAARTSLRLGSEVYLVYRRSEVELPARVEEVHHAKQEGIQFHMLTNPVEILGDDKGWVCGIRCVRMELGEPDQSGRRSPKEIPGSEFVIECDSVIMSLGTSPNPLITSTTPGLDINRWKCIVADEATGKTSREGVFAGGDAVTGAATVILAMGAGRAAAKAMDEYIKSK